MKANEFIIEYAGGNSPTLKQIAAQNRQTLKRDFVQKTPGVKAAVDAVKGVGKAWQNLKGNLANKATMANQAGKYSDAWDEHVKQLGLPPNDLNAYKEALGQWLQDTLKVNLDQNAVNRYVTTTKPGATDRYFSDYFIPHYLEYQKQQQAGAADAQQGQQSGAAGAQAAPQQSATATPDIKQTFADLSALAQSDDLKVNPKQRGAIKDLWMRMGGTQVAESKINHRIGLYEGLTTGQIRSVKLWECAGRRLVEAELTAQQISNIFAAVQQGATAAGGNRTMIGRGKDATSEVASAWEDLKNKISNSGPIKNMDEKYDQAAEKLKQATGGDAGAMKYVQKYRDFATKHPVAQSFLYAALIAAAGISGVGAGGAAALGLFKMVDKLLQGNKFSSAAYSGAKTGAAAGIASNVLGGSQAAPTDADYTTVSQTSASGNLAGVSTDDILSNPAYQAAYQKAIDAGMDSQHAFKLGRAAAQKAMLGNNLNEDQIRQIFRRVQRRQLAEGMMDTVKQAAGKAGDWVRTKGQNLTTKVTADKLQQAWKKAGSPTDAEAVAQIIRDAGVSDDIINNVFQSVNVTLSGQSPQATSAASTVQTSKLDKILTTISSYIDNGGSITPQMRGIVKDLWMRSGGTKIAESKQ